MQPTNQTTLRIGVLSIQGAFHEHKAALLKAYEKICSFGKEIQSCDSIAVVEIRESGDLHDIDGIILPGGESTVMGKSLQVGDFSGKIRRWIENDDSLKKHVAWGTCAGMILLAEELDGHGLKSGGQTKIGGLNVTVGRNYFGRQMQSFESIIKLNDKSIKVNPDDASETADCHGVFIRAPAVIKCNNRDVKILGTVDYPEKAAEPIVVAVQQDNIIATAFHPELTDDLRWHAFFLREVMSRKQLQKS